MNFLHPPVSEGLILVCEKCGKKMRSDSEENPSKELHEALRFKTKKLFSKKEYRSVLTSCIDVCPKDRIAVTLVPNEGWPKFLEISGKNFEENAELILGEMRKK